MVSLYEVEQLVRKMLASVAAPVSAQQEGTLVSDGHRTVNYTGAGVAVSDDPAGRRVNVNIPGSPTATSSSVFVSNTTSVHAKTLWNGSSNDAPPANWHQLSFTEDGTWSTAVAAGNNGPPEGITGAAYIWKTATYASSTEANLLRHVISLPAGTITGATLLYDADGFIQEFRVNGTLVATKLDHESASVVGGRSVPISPSLLTPGANNILAVWIVGQNPVYSWGAWKLTVSYTSAAVDARYQLVSEKDAVSGYAGLNSGGHVALSELGSGTPSGSNFLRGDGTWAAASTNSITIEEVDGAPVVAATILRFPNGSLTDDGGGQVTYTAPGTAAAIFGFVKRIGGGNRTTTSATFVVVDGTNLPITLSLSNGDKVECSFSAQGLSGAGGLAIDVQVAQPTLGTTRLNNSAPNGAMLIGSAIRMPLTFTTEFTAAEAGNHTFQPVWLSTSGTCTITNGTSGADATAIYFSVKKVA